MATEAPLPELIVQYQARLSALRMKEQCTNLTLTHKEGDFKVHKIILGIQSNAFMAAIKAKSLEGVISVYTMNDIPFPQLSRMVDFFYSVAYNEQLSDQEGLDGMSQLQLHTYMFSHGDRYDILILRHLAAHYYLNRCINFWDASDFLQSIKAVYKSTSLSIRGL